MTTTLAAVDRPSLDAAHGDTQTWIRKRLDGLAVELREARSALRAARERKWATDALARRVRQLEKHDAFLVKVNAALAAGYAIVPNFNIELLAVRTSKAPPSAIGESKPRVGAERLPVGRGEYVSPDPELMSWSEERKTAKGETKTVTLYQTTQHAPVDVPFVLMKQELADKLHEAMGAKLFDEIGIVRDQPRGDPVLVGRIIHPKGHRGTWWSDNRGVTFFLAWWFNPTEALDL